jgi:prepilin signal peptidase PulO-like enzyme (type II secretory pathway)
MIVIYPPWTPILFNSLVMGSLWMILWDVRYQVIPFLGVILWAILGLVHVCKTFFLSFPHSSNLLHVPPTLFLEHFLQKILPFLFLWCLLELIQYIAQKKHKTPALGKGDIWMIALSSLFFKEWHSIASFLWKIGLLGTLWGIPWIVVPKILISIQNTHNNPLGGTKKNLYTLLPYSLNKTGFPLIPPIIFAFFWVLNEEKVFSISLFP